MFFSLKRAAAALLAAVMLGFSAVPAAATAPQEILRATLGNGMRVVIVRDPLAPVVTEIVNYLVGAEDAPAGFPGMAHAEEHMVAARSTRELSSSQISTITTLLGGNFNADTQQALTQYFMTAPSDYLDVALRVEAARMRDTLNLQSEWVQERGAIEQEVSGDLSNAFYRYYEKALAALYAGTPYDHDALGTRPSFEKTTGPMLKKFFTSWYAPNNAIVVIAGNVEPQATLRAVKAIFGSIPRRKIGRHPALTFAPVKATVIKDESDFPVPIELLTYRMPGYNDRDFAAAQILADVLTSPRGNLYGLAADGKALGTGFQFQPNPEAGLGFAYVVTAPNADADAAVKLVSDVIAGYASAGVPADLIEAQKAREIAQAQFARNSIEGLAQTWSDAIAVRGLQSPDEAVSQFQKVTPDDVNRVLRTYFMRDKAVVGILTPKPGAVPSGGGSIGVKDTFSPKDAKPVALPIWAARLNAAEVPKTSGTPSDSVLPNGIRLIVQPESVSPTVIVRGEIRHNGSLQTPAGKEGVEAVLDGLFSYGTTTYDRLAFQKELDNIAADISAGTSFSLAVPSQGFERGVQLLADDVLHPALPDAAFNIVQQQTAQGLAGALKSPDYLASRALLTALLPQGDPGLRQATPDTVGGLTAGDIKKYHESVFRPDMTTIVVAGDVTQASAQAVIAKWFGSWKASGPKPETSLPPIPLNSPSSAAISAPGRVQMTVTLRENLGLTRTDPDYYALKLGDAILGGAFYSTRFSRDLRKEGGLVYSVGEQLTAGKTRSSYAVNFGSDPDKVSKARAIVDRDLHDLATKPPTSDEMHAAKTQLIRDLALSESSVDAIAGGYAARSVAELPLDEPLREARIIVGLSAESVRAAFAKWIDPARFVQVNEGPAPK